MGKIKILSENLVNKIAAGEIIDNPASVVKEIIENSLDAKSSQIQIKIWGDEFETIEIQDNGEGISKEDLKLALYPHATSKIQTEEDLFNIFSLGFRGEALCSIASVSQLEIITKQDKNEIGHKLIWDGKKEKIVEIGCLNGTKIIIKNLFYNTPVRKKFLESLKKEFNKILDLISRYALFYFDKSFKLYLNDKPILITKEENKPILKLINIFNKDQAKEMLEIVENEDKNLGLEISGFISSPAISRANKSKQIIFINGREIKNEVITNSIYQGYYTHLLTKQHPIIFLKIKIDPKLIDVNVHPTKKEIRLKDEKTIFNLICEVISKTLEVKNISKNVSPKIIDKKLDVFYIDENEKKPDLIIKETEVEYEKEEEKTEDIEEIFYSQKVLTDIVPDVYSKIQTQKIEKEKIKNNKFRVLGQVGECYIIAETGDGFIIVDQHAGEERLNYEKFKLLYQDKKLIKQKLIAPHILNLDPIDSQILKNNLKNLNDFGFEIELFGDNSFSIRSLPILMSKEQNKEMIINIIDELKTIKKNNTLAELKEKIIIQLACKSSIKKGDFLSMEKMTSLVKKLLSSNLPNSCPHGRPIIIYKTINDLEKLFKRKV